MIAHLDGHSFSPRFFGGCKTTPSADADGGPPPYLAPHAGAHWPAALYTSLKGADARPALGPPKAAPDGRASEVEDLRARRANLRRAPESEPVKSPLHLDLPAASGRSKQASAHHMRFFLPACRAGVARARRKSL
jgi:hypothetical protein